VNRDSRRSIYLRPWRIDIVRRSGVQQPLPGSTIARQVDFALVASNAPRPGSVTVVLTDDEELADLNHEHMGHEGPTDVLSFPMLPPEAFNRSAGVGMAPTPERPEPEPRGRTHIGDIAISVERAAEQAADGRGGQTGDVQWSIADELRLLVTHGTLHLCGWDHAKPDDEAAMRTLERRLLALPEG
jgi:probable rRNA maturation factor